jgi:hypothetical protein
LRFSPGFDTRYCYIAGFDKKKTAAAKSSGGDVGLIIG